MGILNVTPDSCFDQGRWFKTTDAIERGVEIYKQGADLIDVGGESTRPFASPVSEEEELKRVIPVIERLKELVPIPLSIDTMKANVAKAALQAGASFINDVSGFRDPAMQHVAADFDVKICVMHMHGTPQTMQIDPHYPEGIIAFLMNWFEKRIESLIQAGIKEKNIILDPGIGFGKTVQDNLRIIHHLPKLQSLGFPVLLGLSRKSFLGKLIQKTYPDLLPATLAVSVLPLLAQIDILRVHDVSEHRDIIEIVAQMRTTE